jgi:hypothetical protein
VAGRWAGHMTRLLDLRALMSLALERRLAGRFVPEAASRGVRYPGNRAAQSGLPRKWLPDHRPAGAAAGAGDLAACAAPRPRYGSMLMHSSIRNLISPQSSPASGGCSVPAADRARAGTGTPPKRICSRINRFGFDRQSGRAQPKGARRLLRPVAVSEGKDCLTGKRHILFE